MISEVCVHFWRRKKGQMLSIKKKRQIYKQIEDGALIRDIKEIWQISQSTISRIIKDFRSAGSITITRSFIKNRCIQSPSLWKTISSFANHTNRVFTWRDVKDYIMKNKGVWVDINVIRKILKDKLNYSFKRCSSRLLTLNHKITMLKKVLFSIKVLKILERSSIIMNVDEAVISQSTKANYSWSRIGAPSNRGSKTIKGSISIVSIILSNGMSITGVRKGTIASNSFIDYMKHLAAIWARL